MSVWLERKGGWKIDKTMVFSPLAHHNYISLIWWENSGEKNTSNQWLNYPSFSHMDLLLLFHFLFFLSWVCGPGCFSLLLLLLLLLLFGVWYKFCSFLWVLTIHWIFFPRQNFYFLINFGDWVFFFGCSTLFCFDWA